jgi:hypothetical protein
MATQRQIRRGTTAEIAAMIPAAGELVYSTDDKQVNIGDGSTAGGTGLQKREATLTAIAAYNTNGLMTQTAADTFTGRTIAGTANQITATNGDGVSGDPTLSLPGTIQVADVTATKTLQGTLSVQHSGDTNDSSSGSGSDFNHNLTYTLPANFLTSGRAIRVTTHFRATTGGTAPTLAMKLKMGATVVSEGAAAAPANSISNSQIAVSWILQATAAPGASVNCECSVVGQTNALAGTSQVTSTDMPVALATNGTLAITIATIWGSAGVGTNTIKLSQLIVESLN